MSCESCRRRRWAVLQSVFTVLVPLILALSGVAVGASAQEETAAPNVEIREVIYGVGGQCRSGSLTAAWVSVYFAGTEPKRARVVWNMPDPDGDIAQVSRDLTLNPGANPVWLYGPLGFQTRAGSIMEVVVYEIDDNGRPRSQLAARNVGMGSVVSPYVGLIGVVGTDSANLEWYSQPWESGETQPAAAQEPLQVVRGVQAGSLPDQWMGLDALEALVWVEGSPLDLSLQQAAAIEEWVYRGGHLVVVLPQVGDLWTNTPLDAILPAVNVTIWEDQEISGPNSAGGLLKYLSRDRSNLDPPAQNRQFPRVNLHLFSPSVDRNGLPTDDWQMTDCEPIMELDVPGPDGTSQRMAVVLRRHVGFGHVTLVGIPVTDPRLRQPPLYWPHTEVFWNPILGRRQDTPNRYEIDQILQEQRDTKELKAVKVREAVDIGEPFVPMIELAGQAGGGLLLAILLFGIYWVLAGPVMYAWLKSKNLHRHSWLAFVAVIGAFTAIGWVGARALRFEGTRPRHVTVYDHIAGTDWQRCTTYMTLMLNGYGSHEVALVDPAVESDAPDAVAAYARHNVTHVLYPVHGSLSTFPDTREYTQSSSDPFQIDVPSRNTAKQFVFRWFGRPLEGWGMPTASSTADRPRIITPGSGGQAGSQLVRLAGVLQHDLPGPLLDVIVYHVTGEPATNPDVQLTRGDGVPRGRPPLISFAWKLPQALLPWEPGQPLDLGAANLVHDSEFRFVDGVQDKSMSRMMDGIPQSSLSGQSSFNQKQQQTAMELLGAYHLIKPPIWVGKAPDDQVLFHRTMGRELDISLWYTQPCIIITGYLHGGAIPTPVRFDGKPLPDADSASITMIRWIYPL